MSELTLEVDVDGARGDIDVLVGALGPESREEFPGVSMDLERTGDERARLTIEGQDASSVRAAVNAHLRWMRTVEDVLGIDPGRSDDEVA